MNNDFQLEYLIHWDLGSVILEFPLSFGVVYCLLISDFWNHHVEIAEAEGIFPKRWENHNSSQTQARHTHAYTHTRQFGVEKSKHRARDIISWPCMGKQRKQQPNVPNTSQIQPKGACALTGSSTESVAHHIHRFIVLELRKLDRHVWLPQQVL